MLLDAIWIIVLVISVIEGFLFYVNYHNSGMTHYLVYTIICTVIAILEILALTLG